MVRTDPHKTFVSTTLVTLLVLSTFSGLLFATENAEAVSITFNSGPAAGAHHKAGASIPFQFTIEFENLAGQPTETNPRCTFSFNGVDISSELSPGASCSNGPNSKTWTPTATRWAGTEVQSAIQVTVTVDPASGAIGDQDDTSNNQRMTSSNNFVLDAKPPVINLGSSSIRDALAQPNQVQLNALPGQLGAGPYTINAHMNSELFPDDWALLTCAGAVIQNQADANALSTIFTEPFSASSSDATSISFMLRATDKAQNMATTSCLTANVDNRAPQVTLLNDPSGAFLTGDLSLVQGTDFTATDGSGVAQVSLDWGLGSTAAAPPATLTFPGGTIPPGDYTVHLSAKDATGNPASPATFTLKADAKAPVLQSVVFDDHGACAARTLLANGASGGTPSPVTNEYCSGPWDVTITIIEEYPAGTQDNPTPPAISTTDFNFASATRTHTRNAGPGADTHTWVYNGVTRAGSASGPLTFDIELNEVSQLGARGISNAKTNIGFTEVGTPRVNFAPATTVFGSTATFSVTEVAPSGGTCPILSTNQLCAPGSGATVVELVRADGSTLPGAAPSITKSGSTWQISWTPGSSQAVSVILKVTREGRVGNSDAVPVIIDGGSPTINKLTAYQWAPADTSVSETARHWVPITSDSASALVPTQGLTLVKLEYDSFSASEIRFRFVDERDDQLTEANQRYVEYIFLPATTGANAGKAHRATVREDQTVHLARSVPLPGGTSTPASGCEWTTGDPGLPLWGANRVCYFLIETRVQTSQGYRHNRLSSGLADNQKYIIQPMIFEQDGDDVRALPLPTGTTSTQIARVVQGESPEINSVTTPTLNPTAPEVGVSTTVTTKLNVQTVSQIKRVDSWACLMRPLSVTSPNPNVDDPFTEYMSSTNGPDCRLSDQPFPDLSTERAKPLTVEQKNNQDQGDRVVSFQVNRLLDLQGGALDPGEDPADSLYLRLLARDRYNNIVVRDYHASGPGVFNLAQYDIGLEAIKMTVPESEQNYRDNKGCHQPPGTTNSATTPCRRVLGNVKQPSYPAFQFPLSVKNLGNVADTATLKWRNVGGQANWGVALTTQASCPASGSTTETPLDVAIPKPTIIGQAQEVAALVCVYPASEALGGQSATFRVSAESKGSTSNTKPVLETYLRPALGPVSRGSLLLGPSATQSTSIEATPEQILTVPVKLRNTGNTQPTAGFGLAVNAARSTGSPDLCQFQSAFSPGRPLASEDPDDFITLQWQTGAGTPITSRNLQPGQEETTQLRIEIGRNIPATQTAATRCVLDVINRDTSLPISLAPIEPTMLLTIVGAAEIDIFELRGSDRAAVSVLGEQNAITRVVSPSDPVMELELFMENTGTIAIRPELRLRQVSDKFSLGGQWIAAVQGTHETLSTSSSAPPFDLPRSDDDDPTRIRDIFTASGAVAGGATTVSDSRWVCAGKDDGGETADEDPRILCRMVFRFEANRAVTGDEAVYELIWQDPTTGSAPAKVRVKLVFDHIGAVAVDSITNHVVGHAQDTQITYAATLIKGQRFDLTTNPKVPATVSFEYRAPPPGSGPGTPASGHVACTATDGGDDGTDPDTTLQSISANAERAIFRLRVRADASATASTCSWLFDTANNRWAVSVPGAGTIEATLTVTDENGTALRSVRGGQFYFNPTEPTVNRPVEAKQIKLFEKAEMDANGTQFARLLYNPGANQGHNGVLLSRTQGQSALVSYTDCTLGGVATRTNAAPSGSMATWTRYPAADEHPDGAWPLPLKSGSTTQTDPLPHTTPLHGQILKRIGSGSNAKAEHRGNVHLYVWGDAAKPVWREGWNPVVFYIEDENGIPAKSAGLTGAVTPTLEFRFMVRDGSATKKYTDHYQLVGTGSLPSSVVNLGQGYFTTNIYIPEGFTPGQLTPAGTGGDPGPVIEDQRDRGSLALVDHWTMELKLGGSAQSRSGEAIDGSAFWTAEALGFADGAGKSLVKDGGIFAGVKDTTTGTGTITHTAVHYAVRFLNGPLAPPTAAPHVTTGPGVHDLMVQLTKETDSRLTSLTGYTSSGTGDEFKDDARQHKYTAFSNAKPSFVFQPQNRVRAAGGGTLSLQQVATSGPDAGVYATAVNLPDMGADVFTWSSQLTIKDNTNNPLRAISMTINVDAEREAAVNGIPMPLCIHPPAGAVPDEAGDFDQESFSSRTIVDLRGIPGLRPDRGPFSLTPFLVKDGSSIENGVRHDAQGLFKIRGKGLVTLDTAALPGRAEIGVPITVALEATGPVDTITARLMKGSTLVDSVVLTLTDGVYTGQLTPTEEGEHELEILAEDVQGGITVLKKTVRVDENVEPRITVTRPITVNGVRAIRPGGTIEATVEDSSITASAITVERRTSSGSSTTPQDLAPKNNITVTGIKTPTTTGAKTTTVTLTNETGEPLAGKVWVNVSGIDGRGFSAELDGDGKATGSIQLNETGTATLTVSRGEKSETFTVTVASAASGGLTPVTDGVQIDCTTNTCKVTYTPAGMADGDELKMLIRARISDVDQNATEEMTIKIDGTAPTTTVTVGQPKVSSGTTTLVGPNTPVDVEASDTGGIRSLVVRALRGGTELGTQAITGTSGQVVLSELGLTSNGDARIQVVARDGAGNEATEDIDVRVDATGPVLGTPTAELTAAGAVFTVTAEDDAGISGVTLFHRRPGQDTFTSLVMQSSDGSYTATVTNPGTGGTLRYYVQANDALGNQGTAGDSSAPLTLSLGDGPITNQPPVVTISSPTANARVSGTIQLVYEVSDPEGADVTVTAVRVTPTGAAAVPQGVAQGTIDIDTTTLPEGEATITVEATDDIDTGTGSVRVIVDNEPDAGPCSDDGKPQRNQPVPTGRNTAVCFHLPTGIGVQEVEVQLLRSGEVQASRTLTPAASGDYRTTFTIQDEGTYALKIVKKNTDGTTEESTSEAFNVQSFAEEVLRPLGRFIAAMVLGVVVLGLAAFAAFGRWR